MIEQVKINRNLFFDGDPNSHALTDYLILLRNATATRIPSPAADANLGALFSLLLAKIGVPDNLFPSGLRFAPDILGMVALALEKFTIADGFLIGEVLFLSQARIKKAIHDASDAEKINARSIIDKLNPSHFISLEYTPFYVLRDILLELDSKGPLHEDEIQMAFQNLQPFFKRIAANIGDPKRTATAAKIKKICQTGDYSFALVAIDEYFSQSSDAANPAGAVKSLAGPGMPHDAEEVKTPFPGESNMPSNNEVGNDNTGRALLQGTIRYCCPKDDQKYERLKAALSYDGKVAEINFCQRGMTSDNGIVRAAKILFLDAAVFGHFDANGVVSSVKSAGLTNTKSNQGEVRKCLSDALREAARGVGLGEAKISPWSLKKQRYTLAVTFIDIDKDQSQEQDGIDEALHEHVLERMKLEDIRQPSV